MNIRKSTDRGISNYGWLQSRHSFSFGGYQDPNHMGYRSLRVINDDRVAGGGGFPTHPHRNMEILTYVIDGAVAHADSMGNKKTVYAGELQVMSAGTGITHSEFNPSDNDETHFLQIWITPRETGLTPKYAEWKPGASTQPLTLMASSDGRNDSVQIHQDVSLYLFEPVIPKTVLHKGTGDLGYWLQVIKGPLTINSQPLETGDGAVIEAPSDLELLGERGTKALLFEIGN